MKIAHRSALTLLTAMAALCASLLWIAQPGTAAALPPRTSEENGARVVVTPRAIEPGATIWEFDIVTDTHIKPLGEDLVRAATLVDDTGREHPPLSWQGDAPGGHHRKGILRLSVPVQVSKIIELQLSGVGGSSKRVFRWQLD